MKKSVVLIILVMSVMTFLSACGSDEKGTEGETTTPSVQRDLPEGDYEEIGSGEFYIKSPSGSTEEGDEILIYPDMDSIPFAYIDFDLWDLDGSILTYIYLDGVLMEEEQVGGGYQSSLSLDKEWMVTEGTHKVEAVQYADNDTNGKMLFYRAESFEVKAK